MIKKIINFFKPKKDLKKEESEQIKNRNSLIKNLIKLSLFLIFILIIVFKFFINFDEKEKTTKEKLIVAQTKISKTNKKIQNLILNKKAKVLKIKPIHIKYSYISNYRNTVLSKNTFFTNGKKKHLLKKGTLLIKAISSNPNIKIIYIYKKKYLLRKVK